MPIRIRLRFKPEQKSEILEVFESEFKRHKRSVREMQKPLSRTQKWIIAREMKKHEITDDKMQQAIAKIAKGYDFKAEFTSDTEAIIEWKGHFLIDYEGEEGELLAKIMFPMYFGFGSRIKDIGRAVATGTFKKAMVDSLHDPEGVKFKVKSRIFSEAVKIFKDCEVILE